MTINFDLLKSSNPKIKYGFAKELLKTAAEKPEVLYPHYDTLLSLTKDNNNIIKWTGIDLIGYLSIADNDNKTEKQIPALKEFVHGGHLITCNHAIFALGLIAQHKPQYKKTVIAELLQIDKDTFDTDECKNIATGKVLDVLKIFLADITGNKKTVDFIQKAARSTRNATKQKAIRLLKKLQVR